MSWSLGKSSFPRKPWVLHIFPLNFAASAWFGRSSAQPWWTALISRRRLAEHCVDVWRMGFEQREYQPIQLFGVCVWNECMYVCMYVCNIYLSIKLFIDLWTYLSTSSWIESIQMESNTINLISSYLILSYLSTCLYVRLPGCLPVCLSACLLPCLLACLPASVAGWLFVHLFVYLSIHLSNQILTTLT